jgi:hypothetical protein
LSELGQGIRIAPRLENGKRLLLRYEKPKKLSCRRYAV